MSKALDRLKRSSTNLNMRISKPTFHPEKFRKAILFVLDKTGGLEAGRLERILYFIDFDYYEVLEEHLMGATYRKNAIWASTSKLKPTLRELIKTGKVEKGITKYFSLKKPDFSLFNKGEKFMLDEVTEHYFRGPGRDSNRTDVPIIVTQQNCVINYEAAFYRTDVFSARERLYKKSKELEKEKAQMKANKAIKNNIKNF